MFLHFANIFENPTPVTLAGPRVCLVGGKIHSQGCFSFNDFRICLHEICILRIRARRDPGDLCPDKELALSFPYCMGGGGRLEYKIRSNIQAFSGSQKIKKKKKKKTKCVREKSARVRQPKHSEGRVRKGESWHLIPLLLSTVRLRPTASLKRLGANLFPEQHEHFFSFFKFL